MRISLWLILLPFALLLAAPGTAGSAAPEIGKPAPDFLFVGVPAGETSVVEGEHRLADYVGESARKKGVVVAWFPKAFTPG